MIEPTVGHVVWYHPDPAEPYGGQTLAAHVAFIWSEGMVNLMVIDPNGMPFSKTSVPLIQEGDKAPAGGYCELIPYQNGQPAKKKKG